VVVGTFFALALAAGRGLVREMSAQETAATASDSESRHLRNIKQLTFGGQNAEAYFSPDGKKLIFQSTRDPVKCDQIFTMNLDGTDQKMVSTGKGRTTCSYFFGDGKRILYSSTHLGGAECPPKPDYSKGYVWAIYPSYDIFTANADGTDVKQLTKSPGYDAEATLSTDGKKIVFTSIRDGDLDIYTMDADGSHVKQLTHELGYDGGPFFSPNGQLIVYRAHHPKDAKEISDYKGLLAQSLIRPTYLEIWLMDADGEHKRQITNLGAASFAPSFFPDGKRIIFSSNVGSTGGMGNFELYAVDLDGKNVDRITFTDGFDGFPVFSPNGKKLVWVSGRNGKVPHETNIFIADWVN